MNQITPIPATGLPLGLDGEALMAATIRVLAMDAVEAANSGHPGAPMGLAEVAATLVARHLRLDPTAPAWPDRDRLVLSAGHDSMLLYAVHHLLGFADMGMDELRRFRQLGRRTAGHPEYGHALGIEPPRARSGRASPPRSAWRWASACSTPATATTWWTTGPG